MTCRRGGGDTKWWRGGGGTGLCFALLDGLAVLARRRGLTPEDNYAQYLLLPELLCGPSRLAKFRPRAKQGIFALPEISRWVPDRYTVRYKRSSNCMVTTVKYVHFYLVPVPRYEYCTQYRYVPFKFVFDCIYHTITTNFVPVRTEYYYK